MISAPPGRFWLHRISHHAEAAYPLLQGGFLTIGYSDFSESEFLEKTRGGDRSYFDKAFAQKWPTNPQPRTRHNLWHFIGEMQINDKVLVPSWGTFSMFRIETEARLIDAVDTIGQSTWDKQPLRIRDHKIYSGENMLDLGFFRRVTPLETGISRYDFADAALTSRLKYRATTLDITDLADSIEKAVTVFHIKRPINLHSQVLANSAGSLLKLIREELNPDKFELLVAWYFERIGATEVTIAAKNDPKKQGDADIIAVFEPLKTIYYVQAKYHKGSSQKGSHLNLQHSSCVRAS
jgi:hypothetical protein